MCSRIKPEASEEISHDRRRFVGAAALTIAAAEFGMIGAAAAQAGRTKSAEPPEMKHVA
jgi:nitrous oxide reductase